MDDYATRFTDDVIAEANVVDVIRCRIVCSSGVKFVKLVKLLESGYVFTDFVGEGDDRREMVIRIEIIRCKNKFSDDMDPTHFRNILVNARLIAKPKGGNSQTRVHELVSKASSKRGLVAAEDPDAALAEYNCAKDKYESAVKHQATAHVTDSEEAKMFDIRLQAVEEEWVEAQKKYQNSNAFFVSTASIVFVEVFSWNQTHRTTLLNSLSLSLCLTPVTDSHFLFALRCNCTTMRFSTTTRPPTRTTTTTSFVHI